MTEEQSILMIERYCERNTAMERKRLGLHCINCTEVQKYPMHYLHAEQKFSISVWRQFLMGAI